MHSSFPGRCAALRLLTLTSLAVLSSCKPPDSALRVNVTVKAQGTARVRADCIRLTISDETQELKSITIKRPSDDDAVFGVRRGSDLPAVVKVQASGYLGTNCSDESTLKLNAQGEAVTGTFPESGVSEVFVELTPPNTALDGDRDGYVSAVRGGLDCKDDDATVFPGAGQVCANTSDTDCDGQRGCDDSECGTAAVCADPPDRVVITTTVNTMLRHQCRGPFLVELRNANGVRRAIRDTLVTLTASLPGMTVHGTMSCGQPVTSVTIPYDSPSFEVWLSADATAFGLNTLSATAAQVPTAGTATVEVHPQPIHHLALVTPERTLTAGTCGAEPVTLEFRDLEDRRTDVDAPTTLTFTSAPGDIDNANIFFSDTGCTTAGDMRTLAPGEGTVSAYLLARRAGAFTLTATPSAGTVMAVTQPLTVQPGPPGKLAFTNAPLALNTGLPCSAGRFTVQLQDQFDNTVIAPSNVTVRATVNTLVNVQLYPDQGTNPCAMNPAQTDFDIPMGSSSISFRAGGTTATPPSGTIVARALNLSGIADAMQPLSISAGNANKFVMGGTPQNPLANVCSGSPLTINLLDNNNNPAASPTVVTFTLSTSPANADPTFQFYSGAGCQTPLGTTLSIPAGQTSASFYFRGTRARTNFEIQASTPPGFSAPPGFLLNNTIRPGAPGKLQFVAPLTQTAQAGVCTMAQYTANVLDLFDNPTSFTTPQTVTVSSNPAGVTVGSSACNVGNSVPLAANVGVVNFIAQHTVTNAGYALTASVNGFSTATPATLAVIPGPSTLMVQVPAGNSSNLMAGGCQQITLIRRDGFGNNAPTTGSNPITLAFPQGSWIVYSSANCTTGAGAAINMNSNHTVTFSVSPQNNSAGSGPMTATMASTSQSAVVNFNVSPGPSTLVFVNPFTDAGVATASGTAGLCLPFTIARRDGFHNDVPLGVASDVTFPSLPGGTTIHTGSPCVPGNALPTATIPLTATDSRVTYNVYATRSGPQNVITSLAAQSTNLSLTVNPGSPTLSLTLPDAGILQAMQCQRVNTERRDGFNNPVPAIGQPMSVDGGADAGGLEVFPSVDCTGLPNPSPSVSYTAGAATRDFSVRVRLAASSPRQYAVNHEGLSAPLSLTVTPAATALFQIEGLPTNLVSGACSPVVLVRRKDNYTNDTTTGTISVTLSSTGTSPVSFSNTSDCASPTSTLSTTINDGSSTSGTFYVTATAAGAAQVTATQGSVTGTGNFNVIAGSPTSLVFSTPQRTFTAGTCGGAANVITVQLRDAAGNLATTGSALNVTASSTSTGTVTWGTTNACGSPAAGGVFVIPASGSSVSIFYRDTLAGTPTISITNNGGLANPAGQQHTVSPGNASKLVFTTPARTFTAAQCGGMANEIVVQLQDANTPGNAVNAGTGGQSFTAVSSSTGPGVWYTDSNCTNVASGGTFTIPSGSSTVTLYYLDPRAGTPTITLTNPSGLTNPTGQQQTVNVGPPARLVFTSAPQTLNALGCSALTTVTMQDAGGNTVNAGMNRTIQLSATPAGPNVTFWSNASCTNPIPSDQLTMGTSSNNVTFHFKADNAGTATLAADTTGIIQGTQTATITAAPVSSLNITSPSMAVTIEAGFCQPVTVERLDALNRQVTTGTTTITPSGMVGASLFSDASCTTPLGATFNIGAAAGSATIYFKGVTGSLVGIVPGNQLSTLLLTSGSFSDSISITVQPMVRRRSVACTLAGASVTCPITPTLSDISRTILFFQAIPAAGDNNPSDDNVSCRLDPNGGTAQVVCDRVGSTDNITIDFQTLSFPYSFANGGVSVQHLTAGCNASQASAMPINLTLPTPVTVNNTFVLFSSRSAGADNEGPHFFTAQLTATNNLRFSQSASSSTCTVDVDFDAQVVSWAGSTVANGVTAGGSTSPFTVSQTTANSMQTFILYSSRMTGDTGTPNEICRRRLEGRITNGSTLTFTRGCNGADIQDISWQHVRVPNALVQQVTAATANNGASTTPVSTITSVDLTRTVGFIGGLGQGGTASGRTDFNTADRVGTALGKVDFSSSTQLVFTRGAANGIATFTGFVVQVTP